MIHAFRRKYIDFARFSFVYVTMTEFMGDESLGFTTPLTKQIRKNDSIQFIWCSVVNRRRNER